MIEHLLGARRKVLGQVCLVEVPSVGGRPPSAARMGRRSHVGAAQKLLQELQPPGALVAPALPGSCLVRRATSQQLSVQADHRQQKFGQQPRVSERAVIDRRVDGVLEGTGCDDGACLPRSRPRARLPTCCSDLLQAIASTDDGIHQLPCLRGQPPVRHDAAHDSPAAMLELCQLRRLHNVGAARCPDDRGRPRSAAC